MTKLKLLYALVGEGQRISSLHVRASDSVSHLIHRIVKREGLIPATCPRSLVHLYLAKKNGDALGPWLEEGEDELEQLFQTDLPTHIERLYLRDELRLKLRRHVSKYFPDESFTDGLPENPIHLLVDARPPVQRAPAISTIGLRRSSDQVQLLDTYTAPLKRQSLQLQWTREFQPCPQLSFDDSDMILRYLVNSGIFSPQPNADLLLYRRAALVDQWNEIQRDSIDSYARLWIVGGPGTGKSCGAYAFACGKVDRTQWDVLWIHYSRGTASIYCIKFHGDIKTTCMLPFASCESLDEVYVALRSLLPSASNSHNTIVFFDGYAEQYEQCEHVLGVLVPWQIDDPTRRRVVVVASTPSVPRAVGRVLFRGRPLPPTVPRSQPLPAPTTAKVWNEIMPLMKFHLVSWTLNEFEEAIAHDELFHHVQHHLHPLTPTDREIVSYRTRAPLTQRVDLMRQKYLIAGGNARFMFAMPMAGCIDTLENALDHAGDCTSLLHGYTGPNLVPVAHNLIARYFNYSGMVHRVASAYAAKRLAMRLEPNVVLNFT